MLKFKKKHTRATLTVHSCFVNFGYISHLFLVFLLLPLNSQIPTGNKMVSM